MPSLSDARRTRLGCAYVADVLFIIFGCSKLTGFSGTTAFTPTVRAPFPALSTAIAVLLEFFVGLAIVVGFYTRPHPFFALYTLGSALIGHHLWTMARAERAANMIDFYKNVSIIGFGRPSDRESLDYSLKRWEALTRYLDDGQVPIDNNWVENQIRPWAIGRANWLVAGSLRAGQRAAAIMSLLRSAQLDGHDPDAYLKDIRTRLPTHKASENSALLPHRWRPPVTVA
jgi:uncharacterized membrane protein YphA (DoxX/SURF4 family)